MSEIRDALADAISAVRAETQGYGEVRVELATLNGNIATLAAEIRGTQQTQGTEIAELKTRTSAVERLVWRGIGAAGVLGLALGTGAGVLFA